jgi:hypothetical protein
VVTGNTTPTVTNFLILVPPKNAKKNALLCEIFEGNFEQTNPSDSHGLRAA